MPRLTNIALILAITVPAQRVWLRPKPNHGDILVLWAHALKISVSRSFLEVFKPQKLSLSESPDFPSGTGVHRVSWILGDPRSACDGAKIFSSCTTIVQSTSLISERASIDWRLLAIWKTSPQTATTLHLFDFTTSDLALPLASPAMHARMHGSTTHLSSGHARQQEPVASFALVARVVEESIRSLSRDLPCSFGPSIPTCPLLEFLRLRCSFLSFFVPQNNHTNISAPG